MWPRTSRAAMPASALLMASRGSRKSPNRATFEKRRIGMGSGRLGTESSFSMLCTMCSAMRRTAVRPDLAGMPLPSAPMRSPPWLSRVPSARDRSIARSRFETGARSDLKSMDAERSAQSQTVLAASHSFSPDQIAVRFCRFAPVYHGGEIARTVSPELPECLAGACPAAAVEALCHGVGNAIDHDQQCRKHVDFAPRVFGQGLNRVKAATGVRFPGFCHPGGAVTVRCTNV